MLQYYICLKFTCDYYFIDYVEKKTLILVGSALWIATLLILFEKNIFEVIYDFLFTHYIKKHQHFLEALI